MKQISPERDEDMIGEEEPVEKHAKWVGVLLSFVTSGAGQFLAGYRMRGFLWFGAMNGLGLVAFLVMASPWFKGALPGLIILMAVIGLWFVMLFDAWRPLPRRGFWKWVGVVVACLTINYLASSVAVLIIHPFKVPSNGMAPTIRGNPPRGSLEQYTGDYILAEKFAYWFGKPQRGDIVVFRNEWMTESLGVFFVMRVVGLPGEKVSIKNDRLFVNGSPVSEPRIFSRLAYTNKKRASYLRTPDEEYVVPVGCYFVLGDNSANSADSRFFGPVPEKNIIGKVTKIYWPPERMGIPE